MHLGDRIQSQLTLLTGGDGAILDFLAHEFAEGKQYGTLNSYRSAILMTDPPIDGTVIGKHSLVSRLMWGIFDSRPPPPKYILVCLRCRKSSGVHKIIR